MLEQEEKAFGGAVRSLMTEAIKLACALAGVQLIYGQELRGTYEGITYPSVGGAPAYVYESEAHLIEVCGLVHAWEYSNGLFYGRRVLPVKPLGEH